MISFFLIIRSDFLLLASATSLDQPSDGDSSDSSEILSDSSFDVLLMGFGKKLGGLSNTPQFITTFQQSNLDQLYFGDHMAPFRSLMHRLKDSSEQQRSRAIRDLVVGHHRKVMVAVTGRVSDTRSEEVAKRAISFLLGVEPRDVVHLPDSAWIIMQLKHTSDIEKLVAQQVVIEPVLKLLIVFRPILTTSNLNRVVQVKGVQFGQDLKELKEKLEAEGASVVEETPPSEQWTPTFSERVVWKLRAPYSTWAVPTIVPLTWGQLPRQCQLHFSPLCSLCHSDDHHRGVCGWEQVIRLL